MPRSRYSKNLFNLHQRFHKSYNKNGPQWKEWACVFDVSNVSSINGVISIQIGPNFDIFYSFSYFVLECQGPDIPKTYLIDIKDLTNHTIKIVLNKNSELVDLMAQMRQFFLFNSILILIFFYSSSYFVLECQFPDIPKTCLIDIKDLTNHTIKTVLNENSELVDLMAQMSLPSTEHFNSNIT